jgi:hypothetical protein
MVDNADAPEESTLDQLRLWLEQRSRDQACLYKDREWYEFRMLPPAKGPIEKLVKALMPLSRLGRAMLVSNSIFSFCIMPPAPVAG